MKEIDLQSKTCVVPVAIVACLGMAGLGLVSSGVARADVRSSTDNINVNVLLSCTFNGVASKTYAGSAYNGTEVGNFDDAGVHVFNLSCNDKDGYTVLATPHDLEATGIDEVIAYTDNYTHSGADGMWTAAIASDTTGVTVVNPVVPVGGGPIIAANSNTGAGGTTFTATYSAYVGIDMSAGTYSGTIVYTLIAPGMSNGGSGSGGASQNNNGGDSGDSGTETTDNANNGGGTGEQGSGSGDSGSGNFGSGDAGSGDSGSGNTGTGNEEPSNTDSGNSGNTQSSIPSAAPLALNNTYNTYNASNYSGSGTSTPAVANTQNATSSTTGGSGAKNSNSTETGSSYEDPLGVKTSTTSSSDESSGFDPMPIVATGAVLAVAGVAAVALAKSNKEEEK